MLLFAALDALVVGLVLGVALAVGVRHHPDTASASVVVAVVGSLTGGLLGYSLIAASRPTGLIQTWAIVGGAVGAAVLAYLWLQWVGIVAPLLPERPPRVPRPARVKRTRTRSNSGGGLAELVVVVVAAREMWRRRG